MPEFIISEDELIELTVKVCDLGKDMDITPDRFAIMISMIARHLSEAQGITVTSEKFIDA